MSEASTTEKDPSQDPKTAYDIGNDTFIKELDDGSGFLINHRPSAAIGIVLDHAMLSEMFSWIRTHFKTRPICPVCDRLITEKKKGAG